MQKLSARQYIATPWKNGGGTTSQIAAFPSSAGLDDFDWRISMARVAADGPFSSFVGIDRSLVVLSGAGMALTIYGARHVLTVNDEAFSFDGGASVEGRLIGGEVIDFNVMTRRRRAKHLVQRLGTGGGIVPGQALVALFATEPAVVVADEQNVELGLHDTLFGIHTERLAVVSGAVISVLISY